MTPQGLPLPSTTSYDRPQALSQVTDIISPDSEPRNVMGSFMPSQQASNGEEGGVVSTSGLSGPYFQVLLHAHSLQHIPLSTFMLNV